MGTKRFSLWLDSIMLLALCLAESKSLTGIPLHEWLSMALVAGILAHLLIQWPWVESRSRRLFTRSNIRTRVNYLLNVTLFLFMIATIVSGIMLSENVFPGLTHGFAESRSWHQIHEFCGHGIIFLAGLHLAVNWDWIRSLLRKRTRRGSVQTRPAIAGKSTRLVPRPAAIIAVCAIASLGVFVLNGFVRDGSNVGPRASVIESNRDGNPAREMRPQNETRKAPFSLGMRVFATIFVTVGVTGLVGRTILRLRL